MGLVHYQVFIGSNNGEIFGDFIRELKTKVKGHATVIMDNHPIHKCQKVQDQFTSKLQCMLLPPYSCRLNPIELLWADIKRVWRVENLGNHDL